MKIVTVFTGYLPAAGPGYGFSGVGVTELVFWVINYYCCSKVVQSSMWTSMLGVSNSLYLFYF